MIKSPVGKNILAVLVLLTALASWAIFYLEKQKTDLDLLFTAGYYQGQGPADYAATIPQTNIFTMVEPEIAPGWVLFDSIASGEFPEEYHFAFVHPSVWSKMALSNDARGWLVMGDYDVNKTIPDSDRPDVGIGYTPDEYCRITVNVKINALAPEIYYENTHRGVEYHATCAVILEKVKKTFWYDFK